MTAPAWEIDINSDLGEGFGQWRMADDDALFDSVTSANIACGFHAGDPSIMRNACERAVANGVTIGAHVGYRDLVGFGRRRIDVDPAELRDEIIYQIAALDGFASVAGDAVRYVKPHGALYSAVATNLAQARALINAVVAYNSSLVLLVPRGSRVWQQAKWEGLACVSEAFADRAYAPNGQLLPRNRPGAVIHDVDVIAERIVKLATEGKVVAVDGSTIDVEARSICVHGDTHQSVDIARQVRHSLIDAGARVVPFAGGRPDAGTPVR